MLKRPHQGSTAGGIGLPQAPNERGCPNAAEYLPYVRKLLLLKEKQNPFSAACWRTTGMTTLPRIDVHQHVVPPFYAEALASHGGDPSGSVTPTWTPQGAIDLMDSLEIATGMLSVTTPSC